MADRLDKIYTRSGDQGTTAIASGKRLLKCHPRIETLGDIDELNSVLGVLIAEIGQQDALHQPLSRVQNELFDLGGEIAIADAQYQAITADHLTALETLLDRLNSPLPPLREFILPGGDKATAYSHLARTLCRRAERRLVELAQTDESAVNPDSIRYVNRLSDLLFVIARTFARRNGGEEVFWKPSQTKA